MEINFSHCLIEFSRLFSPLSADKQQEVDVQTFDNQPSGLSSGPSGNPQRARSPRTMSQISGFKRPLMHTNSFTSDRLPVYGVETPHEATLGAMLNDINTWGIDIFKIGTLSCNRPLTCVAYQIFQVRPALVMNRGNCSGGFCDSIVAQATGTAQWVAGLRG